MSRTWKVFELCPDRSAIFSDPGIKGLLVLRSGAKLVRAKIPQGSRLDFVLEAAGKLLFLEVKSVNWVEDGVALFPDGVTSRGRRHLEHLQELVGQGHQAWNVFVVQRHDARVFKPAAAIDPAYARELAAGAAGGVQIMVLQEKIEPPEITLASLLPFDLT